MRDLVIAILLLWGLGGIAAICHLRRRVVLGNVVLLLVLCGFTRTAIVHRIAPVRAPFFIALSGAAQLRAPLAVLRTPDAERGTPDAEKPYVASIRNDSEVYHLRTCSKFDGELRNVFRWSEKEAKASGRRPCSYCLGNSQAVANPANLQRGITSQASAE